MPAPLPDFQQRPAVEGPGTARVDASHSEVLDGIKQGVLWGAAIAVLGLPLFRAHPVASPQAAALQASAPQPMTPRSADFGDEPASSEAREVANWVVTSGDNRNLFFVILDKLNTK